MEKHIFLGSACYKEDRSGKDGGVIRLGMISRKQEILFSRRLVP